MPINTGYPNFFIDFSEPGLNDLNYSLDGVDRSRWKFDDRGFAQATDNALLAARRLARLKIRSIHDDIVGIMHPSDYQVTLDGVPIDKVKFRG